MMTFDYQTAAMQTISGKFKSDYINAPIHIEGKLTTEQEIKDRIIVFSIMTNNCISKSWKVRPALDRFMAELAGF